MTFLTDAECEALFMCEPPAGQTRRDQIEQILARHVEAALNAAADEIGDLRAIAGPDGEQWMKGAAEMRENAARLVRAAANNSGP